MACVGFNDTGYDYYNKENYILFSADNTHNYLFDYITTDLSYLPKIFDQYVSGRMNPSTFELRHNRDNAENINEIKEILISAHPYYEYEYIKVIMNAIGNYFNKLLLHSIYVQKTFSLECSLKEDWYYQKLHALIPSSLTIAGNYPNGCFPLDFYHQYKEWVNDVGYKNGEVEETFILNVSPKMPTGFSEELQIQKRIQNMLYFILDVSAQGMENLTTSQRIWLYGNIFYKAKNLSEMRVIRKLSFRPPALYSEKDRIENPYFPYLNEGLKNDDKMDSIFHLFYMAGTLDIATNGIPNGMMDSFHSITEYAKTISPTKIYEEYEINNLQELLSLEIMAMIQSGVVIKKCENCGKYFVRNDKKKKYCDRINQSGVRCSITAKNKQHKQKLDSDPAYKKYNTAYKTHYARTKSGFMTEKEFKSWQFEGQTKLDQVRKGKLDISIFQEWLKK